MDPLSVSDASPALSVDTNAGVVIPDSSVTNYTDETDTSLDSSNEAANSTDNFFKYAKATIGLAQQTGILSAPKATSTPVAVNPNGTLQPTGANPVVQTNKTTTAPGLLDTYSAKLGVSKNILIAGSVAVGALGLFAIYKAVK